jgi:hypothetical protein
MLGSREGDMQQRIESFEEFWPHYVHAHRNPVNRALHFVGLWATTAAATA